MSRKIISGLVVFLFLMTAHAVERDYYGVPLPKKELTVFDLSNASDDVDQELGSFESTVRGAGYTGEVLMDGTIGGEETYVVIGLNDTAEFVDSRLRDSGSAFKGMIFDAPEHLEEAFLDSPARTGRKIGRKAAKNWNRAVSWLDEHMSEAGRSLEVHKAHGLPLAVGRAVVAVTGSTAVLVLRLPVEGAIELTKGLLRSTWALTKDPVSGTLHLGTAAASGAYGAGSSVAGAVVSGSITLVAATLEGVALLFTAPRKLLKVLF
ncbi:MAG: hypothetical protein HYW47_07255 [Deltaproteobacteria bacterium]|nr:hypothetical protein [Deltaproteobacteria bacterium]